MKFGKFLLSRIATFLLVIFIGVTTVFFVPRLMPNDPVEAMIGQMTSNAGSMSPEAVEQMRESMNSLFGLDGSSCTNIWIFLNVWLFLMTLARPCPHIPHRLCR